MFWLARSNNYTGFPIIHSLTALPERSPILSIWRGWVVLEKKQCTLMPFVEQGAYFLNRSLYKNP